MKNYLPQHKCAHCDKGNELHMESRCRDCYLKYKPTKEQILEDLELQLENLLNMASAVKHEVWFKSVLKLPRSVGERFDNTMERLERVMTILDCDVSFLKFLRTHPKLGKKRKKSRG